MAANKVIIDKQMLNFVSVDAVPKLLQDLLKDDFNVKDQLAFRDKLYNEWDDVSQLIVNETVKFKRKK